MQDNFKDAVADRLQAENDIRNTLNDLKVADANLAAKNVSIEKSVNALKDKALDADGQVEVT